MTFTGESRLKSWVTPPLRASKLVIGLFLTLKIFFARGWRKKFSGGVTQDLSLLSPVRKPVKKRLSRSKERNKWKLESSRRHLEHELVSQTFPWVHIFFRLFPQTCVPICSRLRYPTTISTDRRP